MVGYGELGKQFFDFLKVSNPQITESIFFDDNLFRINKNSAYSFNNFTNEEFGDYEFYVSLGYLYLKSKSEVINKLLDLGRKLPVFIHPTTFVNSTTKLGHNTFVYPMCNIDKECLIGKGVLINNSVTLSHNNIIGDCCYISPGVTTSGYVEIGENSFIGIGTIISNKIKIGKNVKIGIGSVINRDIPDGCSAIGNPVKILDKELNLL